MIWCAAEILISTGGLIFWRYWVLAEMVKTLINGNWPLLLPKHRADRPDWHTEAGWERARLDSMEFHLGLHDTVFYIGAEEGEMPALCALWGADVVLVEPNDKVWPNIRAVWEANGLRLPKAMYQAFASDESVGDTGLYYTWPICSEGPVISDHGFKQLKDAGDIPQIRIDAIPATPTAIILDVEGSEWEVLKGAVNTLENDRPKIWLSGHPEFMYEQYDQYLGDLRKWIKDFGYRERLLDYSHEVHLFYEAIE